MDTEWYTRAILQHKSSNSPGRSTVSTSSSGWWVALPGIASITALTITGMSFLVRGTSTSPSEEPLILRLLELEARMELMLRVVLPEELGLDFPLLRLLLNRLLDLDFPFDACLVWARTFKDIINTITRFKQHTLSSIEFNNVFHLFNQSLAPFCHVITHVTHTIFE